MEEIDFQTKINELAHKDTSLQARGLTFLSDVSSSDLATLRLMWPGISGERRRQITRTLRDLAEDNIDFNFTRFFQTAADDIDPRVRQAAIEGLWEDEGPATLRLLIDRLSNDPDSDVQTAAALALSRFVYLSELGRLKNDQPEQLRGALLAAVNNPHATPELRRRAIEALSYLSADEEVTNLIANGYKGGEKLKASALLGMGRNMDPRWEPILLHEIKSDNAEMRFEAARAIGEQGNSANVPVLLPLLDDDDSEVVLATIWSLGQLGGRVAEQALNGLRRDDNPAIVDAAIAALEELRLADNPLIP